MSPALNALIGATMCFGISFWTYMIGENELQLLTTFAKEFGSSCKNLPFYFEKYLLCI
jgi:hypothetical protein